MQPELFNFSRLESITKPHVPDMRDYFFLNEEMGMVRNGKKVFQLVFQRLQPPFIIDDYRLGLVTQGESTINVNLVEKKFTPGMMVFLGPGSIVNDIRISDDYDMTGLALFHAFPMPFSAGQMPSLFNGEIRDTQIVASPEQTRITQQLMNLIWDLLQSGVQNTEHGTGTLYSLVAALMQHYNVQFTMYNEQMRNSNRQSPATNIFDRFIYLVSRNAAQQHRIAYYADKMHLTERYLGAVIRQSSGMTAKEWIDKTLVSYLKAELRHSDKSLNQLAEEMNFPNTSFLCKYFKRMTGLSPLAYRTSEN